MKPFGWRIKENSQGVIKVGGAFWFQPAFFVESPGNNSHLSLEFPETSKYNTHNIGLFGEKYMRRGVANVIWKL